MPHQYKYRSLTHSPKSKKDTDQTCKIKIETGIQKQSIYKENFDLMKTNRVMQEPIQSALFEVFKSTDSNTFTKQLGYICHPM